MRPSETFSGTFSAYPAEALLIDLLRSNLTGVLKVEAQPGDDGFYFREGIPISVGAASEEVEEALVSLVAEGRGEFSFVEGQSPPPGSTRAALRTLPVLFAALSRPRAHERVERFLRTHEDRRIRLNDTYPRTADPFGFPPPLEKALRGLEASVPVLSLCSGDLSREVLGAALLSLSLADMLSFEGQDAARRVVPHSSDHRVGLSEEPDLVLHEEAAAVAAGPAMPNREATVTPSSSPQSSLKARRAEIAQAVDPLRGKDYLEILRVTPETKPDQIDRSRQYLAKQLAKGEGPGPDAVRELLNEAFEVLTDPVRGVEYRKLVKNATTQKTLRKRQAFEARPKLARVAAKVAQGEFAQAAFLIDWAAALDPELPEIAGHRSFLEFCLRPGPEKPEFAIGLRLAMEQLVAAAPKSLSLRLYLVILYVAMGEREAAPALFSSLKDAEEHPLYPLAQVAVAALG